MNFIPGRKNQIECYGGTFLMQDTYNGVLSARGVHGPNNARIELGQPIAYISWLYKELNKRLKDRGQEGVYTVDLRVNPKDHRVLLSATLTYGKRKITFTNTHPTDNKWTGQKGVTVTRINTVIATRTMPAKLTAQNWANRREKEWTNAGYVGQFNITTNTKKPILRGTFTHKNGMKKVVVTSSYKDNKLQIKIIQTVTFSERIQLRISPQEWVRNITSVMTKDGFKGKIEKHSDQYSQLVIYGEFKKTQTYPNGSDVYTTIFTNREADREKNVKPAKADPSTYRPEKKVGRSTAQVRSIAQDDETTPEFTGRKINWYARENDQLYREYLAMPGGEVELSEKRLAAELERAVSKGQKRALKWLRQLKQTKPAWLKAPNAYNLALYCIKYMERTGDDGKPVMTPAEATKFCINNAYKGK